MVLHRSGLLLLSSSSGLVAVLPFLSGCALRLSLAVRRAVISLHPVSSRSAGHFGSDRLVSPLPHYCWSRVHGHASAGLLVGSQRWGCCSWFYRASWLARGSPPTSPVALLLAFRNGAPSGPLLRVFRFKSSRWGHPSRPGLSQSSIGSKALAPPSWCMLRVFAMGSPCRVVVCSRSRSKRRLVWRTFPCGWCLAFAMGSPILGRVALFCTLDRNEGFLHSSILSCFAMGSPGGSSVWFPALDRNEAVFG